MRKGLAAGAVGGLAGTWAMNEAQRAWTRVVDGTPPVSAAGKHDARDWQERSEGQNSNEIAAQTIATIAGRPLSTPELGVAAALVHFSFGAAAGALYGARTGPEISMARGVAFGLAVWLLADEIAMPLLGLSDSTLRRPLEKRLQSIAAHMVFGATTEVVRGSVQTWSKRRTSPLDKPSIT